MIQIIVCCDEHNGIGYKNELLFKNLKGDMTHFKNQTFGTVCLMGRNTWNSLQFKLPNRINVVLSRNQEAVETKIHKDEIQTPDLLIGYQDPIEVIQKLYPDKDISIIGGAVIYKQFITRADEIWMTCAHAEKIADTWFPNIDETLYKMKESFYHEEDQRNECSFTIEHWVRIPKCI